MNIRPADLKLLCKALEHFASLPLTSFPEVSPAQLQHKQTTAKNLIVRIRFQASDITPEELSVLSAACQLAVLDSSFSRLDKQTLAHYQLMAQLDLNRSLE